MFQGGGLGLCRTAALAVAGLGLAASAQAYVVRENGNPGTGNARDQARAVAVAPNGQVIVAGTLEAGPGNLDGTVRQYGGRDGGAGWAVPLSGGAGLDRVFRMEMDGTGNVAVVGSLHDPVTFDDFSLALVSAAGQVRWHRTLDGAHVHTDPGDDFEIADAVAFDTAGDVIVGGRLDNRGNFGDAAVLKLGAADGGEIWRRVMDEEGPGLVYDLLPVSGGDVYVAAGIARPRNDGVVMRLSGQDGSVLWRRDFEGAGGGFDERMLSLALHPSGDIIAGGALDNGGAIGRDAVIARLRASDGTIVWQRVVDWPGGVDYIPGEEAQEVAVDAAGDVYASGYVTSGSGADLWVTSLDGATGADRWARAVDGGAGGADMSFALALTSDGGVIAAGFVATTAGLRRDAVVLRLSAGDGSETWRAVFPAVEGATNVFWDVALDRLNNPVAAGGLVGEPGDLADFAVVKLSALTGADFVDTDGDGLSDPDEVARGTDPAVIDTDHDGMGDGDEVVAGTNPTNPDSDGDGVPDGAENVHGLVQGAPDGALHSAGARTAFLSRLDAIFAAIAAGDTEGAADQLRNLRRWVDGCEATPPAPDHDDKVTDCALQDQIRAQIDLLLSALGG